MTEPVQKTEREQQIEKLTAAIIHVLLFSNEQPYPIPVPVATKAAEMAYQCGVRQTDEIAEEIELPGWVMEQVREQSTEVPVDVDPYEPQETSRVVEAPKCPKRIAKSKMAVVVTPQS
ncbi:hypothetical protein [Gordonia alkanivorans]|uniref:hypothetical protein n=1 Tax=Gordonia alkanivorans TaxID=84096 RepID=UPI0024B7D994|nr:hypothetical protein [Gordonia alkanivorans]MDJ0010090.1 hypothetical protein [Gordonia alkanivorans]MDJ0495720.1 hypothetical protein [Gordonia alkanivorans]